MEVESMKHVLIIGSGLSGLTCAIELAAKELSRQGIEIIIKK